MKILLVYPECPETFWSFTHVLKLISKKSILPPLGLLTVASMLPSAWERRLIDMSIEELKDDDILWADLVFISAMAIQETSVKKVLSRCKSLGAKIVAGGPLFTSMPESFDEVDHFVLNEAEITLGLFIEDFEKGQARRFYKADEWIDMKESPGPAWDLLDMKSYGSMCIQYSRGCPFSCDFCDITKLFGNKIRAKTADQLVAELESLYSYGWREAVFIVDDNFIGNKRVLKDDVLPAMIEWMREHDYPFVLNTQVSINLADDEQLMEMMALAGFDTVFIGIETPEEDSLKECSKFQNRGRDLVESVKKIQSHGMQVQGGFILGFDSDGSSTFESLITFIQASGIVTAMVGLLNAPRGTKLHKRLLAEKRLLNDSTGNNTDYSMNFIPKMDQDDLIEGYKRVVSTIYSHQFYYSRIKTFLRGYGRLHNQKMKIAFCDLRVFFKSLWYLGIRDKGKFYFWSTFLWTLLRSPRQMYVTMMLSIYGYHFRRIFSSC